VYSSHALTPLTPHNASLNNPEAGSGLHQLGGRAQQWLAWKLKVGRNTWSLVNNQCFIHEQAKQIVVLGRYWSQRAKLHQTCTVLWSPSCTIWVCSSQLHRLSSVQYGVICCGTVNTVKTALVWRGHTSLITLTYLLLYLAISLGILQSLTLVASPSAFFLCLDLLVHER